MNKQKRHFIIRTIAMSLLLATVATFSYLYYYVLVFNANVYGKVYGQNIIKGGLYEVKNLKYSYEYDGVSYFDEKGEVVLNELELGDSLRISLFRFYPQKHRITEVHRDVSKPQTYNPENEFTTKYHMHINSFQDYQGPDSKLYTSNGGHSFQYSAIGIPPNNKLLGDVLDKINYNQGSLIESSIIRHSKDSVILYQIYYYLNSYSLDAKPPGIIKQELQKTFPDKKIKVSVLDKSNPKHERIIE